MSDHLLLLFVYLCLAILPSLVFSKEYFPSELPNPYISKQNAIFCGHDGEVEKSKICDPDHLLNKNEIEQIEKLIQDASTKANIYLVIIDEIAMEYKLANKNLDSNYDISSTFGIDLYLQWGIGSGISGGDYGILVILSSVEGYVNVIKGSNIADQISLNAISNIIRKAKRKPIAPGYTSNKILTDLITILTGKKTVSHFETSTFGRYKTKTMTLFDLWPIGLLGAVAIIYQLYKINKFKNLKAGYYKLGELIKDIQSLKNGVKIYNCPHCLTAFEPIVNPRSHRHNYKDKGGSGSGQGSSPNNINNNTSNDSTPESESSTLLCGHTFCIRCYYKFLYGDSVAKPVCLICQKAVNMMLQDSLNLNTTTVTGGNSPKNKHFIDYQEINYRIQRLYYHNSTTFDSLSLQAIEIEIESKNINNLILLIENRKKAVEASLIPSMTKTAGKKKKKV